MKTKDIDALADMYGGEMLRMDGFDHCCVGVVERFGLNPFLCYNKGLVIKELERQGMTNEEAWEFFEYNQLGAWWGDGTPCFIDLQPD